MTFRSRAEWDPHARLLADVGDTNARFGWQRQRGARIEDIAVLLCAERIARRVFTQLRPIAAAGIPSSSKCQSKTGISKLVAALLF